MRVCKRPCADNGLRRERSRPWSARFAGFGLLIVMLSFVPTGPAFAAGEGTEGPFARLHTDAGDILVVFYPDLAPHHVAQFGHLSRTGFYEGTYFHRLVPGFVIQGGDPNSKDRDPRNDGQGGPDYRDVLTDEELRLVDQLNVALGEKGYSGIATAANLKAEFSKTAKHQRGTLSMARARDVDSAGSQFFICVAPTPQLDGQYTIFGQVVMGMDVVDAIVAAPKDPARGRDAPAEPVHIRAITWLDDRSELSDLEQQAYHELKVQQQTGVPPK
jgi:cyclophilin family peptidyl-prolyl cis-trans isomerase